MRSAGQPASASDVSASPAGSRGCCARRSRRRRRLGSRSSKRSWGGLSGPPRGPAGPRYLDFTVVKNHLSSPPRQAGQELAVQAHQLVAIVAGADDARSERTFGERRSTWPVAAGAPRVVVAGDPPRQRDVPHGCRAKLLVQERPSLRQLGSRSRPRAPRPTQTRRRRWTASAAIASAPCRHAGRSKKPAPPLRATCSRQRPHAFVGQVAASVRHPRSPEIERRAQRLRRQRITRLVDRAQSGAG